MDFVVVVELVFLGPGVYLARSRRQSQFFTRVLPSRRVSQLQTAPDLTQISSFKWRDFFPPPRDKSCGFLHQPYSRVTVFTGLIYKQHWHFFAGTCEPA
ncbi:hypothetical protein FKM82_017206 [Ascaphus truei]